jgi:hypothetical protein
VLDIFFAGLWGKKGKSYGPVHFYILDAFISTKKNKVVPVSVSPTTQYLASLSVADSAGVCYFVVPVSPREP